MQACNKGMRAHQQTSDATCHLDFSVFKCDLYNVAANCFKMVLQRCCQHNWLQPWQPCVAGPAAKSHTQDNMVCCNSECQHNQTSTIAFFRLALTPAVEYTCMCQLPNVCCRGNNDRSSHACSHVDRSQHQITPACSAAKYLNNNRAQATADRVEARRYRLYYLCTAPKHCPALMCMVK